MTAGSAESGNTVALEVAPVAAAAAVESRSPGRDCGCCWSWRHGTEGLEPTNCPATDC